LAAELEGGTEWGWSGGRSGGLRDDVQVAAEPSWRQRQQQHEEMSIILVARVGGRTRASFQPQSGMGCVEMAALTTTASSSAFLWVSRKGSSRQKEKFAELRTSGKGVDTIF